MSNSFVNNFVDEFNTNLELLSQQEGSRFRESVMVDHHMGEGAAAVDQIQSVVGERRTTRHAPKPVIETIHDRRWVYPTDFDWGDIVDNQDKLRTHIAPEGKYTQNGLAAIHRNMDDEIVDAMFADARTGVRGATTTAFPSTQEIAVGTGSSGDTGLNTDKLLAAREKIMAANVDLLNPNNKLYCGISAQFEHQLLEQIKVGNNDYNTNIFSRDGSGHLADWFGITFVLTERLATNGDGDFRIPFWAKSGMHLGVWKDVFGNIERRLDLTREPLHVTTGGTFGATRLEEVKVVEIICDPTAN